MGSPRADGPAFLIAGFQGSPRAAAKGVVVAVRALVWDRGSARIWPEEADFFD